MRQKQRKKERYYRQKKKVGNQPWLELIFMRTRWNTEQGKEKDSRTVERDSDQTKEKRMERNK
jgi:hypothetical protein